MARVRRDFVANVSHELKTPVGALHLLAEALLDARRGRPRGGRAGSPSGSSTSRPGWAGWSTSCSSCPGCRAPSRCPRRCRSRSTGSSPRWSTGPGPRPRPRASRSASPVPAGLTVYGNESQLVTAVANLVENAIAYSRARTTKVDASITCAADERLRRDRRHRPGHRHRAEGSRPDLRAVLPGRPGPLAGDRRHRPRPGHRQAHRDQPRRPGRRGQSTDGAGSTFTLRLPARPPEAALPLPPAVEIDSDGSDVTLNAGSVQRGALSGPGTGRRGRGVVLRRAVLHAAQGGLRGRGRRPPAPRR